MTVTRGHYPPSLFSSHPSPADIKLEMQLHTQLFSTWAVISRMVSVSQPVLMTFHTETVNAPVSVKTLDITRVNRNTVASLHSFHLNLIPSNTAPDKGPPIVLPNSLTHFDRKK